MKVYFDSVGCRLNQSEIERYALEFRAAGHEVVGSSAEADLVVLNTCSVTSEAASDSRQKVRRAARELPAEGGIVVTGCWSTLEPDAAARLPRVRLVVPNLEKDHLVSDFLGNSREVFDLEPVARVPLPGLHQRTRAFLKVQDGCDNLCTFCVTRIARGPGRSRPVDAVLQDVRSAIAGGAKEIVLSGVHLGSWGQDFERPAHLKHLIENILGHGGFSRLRLSSLEPWDLDEPFLDLFQDRRLCAHFHLPLQSGSAATLKRMARKTSPTEFSDLIQAIRRRMPEAAITTDVIVGFPGETEAEFGESLNFVSQMRFAGGHVFGYSVRPGTAAARLPHPVPTPVRKKRSEAMRQLFEQAERSYAEQFVGRTVEVLWEATDRLGPDGWRLHGLTSNYLKVSAVSSEKRWNQVSLVEIQRWNEEGRLEGRIVGGL